MVVSAEKETINEFLNKDWYTTKELSQLLNVTVATVCRYVRTGKLQAIYQGKGSKMQIPADSVKEFLEHSLGVNDGGVK